MCAWSAVQFVHVLVLVHDSSKLATGVWHSAASVGWNGYVAGSTAVSVARSPATVSVDMASGAGVCGEQCSGTDEW